ncbi:MAG: FAD-binding oxidoreductase [Chloroflexi bacterium]|nr:FAD-binding oxidoreductase [Chloroflexota bacterium]
MRVVVIGAGVFGSWTARWLQRRGASVTLVDQYGPGNPLASSGDESRVTRSGHGPDDHYPVWQRRSLTQWLELDRSLFVRTGVLWFAQADDGFEAALGRHARAAWHPRRAP